MTGETVGERLKRIRTGQGKSQRDIQAPGVSYAYISRIEAGTRDPSVKALRKLAANLGVTPGYLETGTDEIELRVPVEAADELAVRIGRAPWAELDEDLRAEVIQYAQQELPVLLAVGRVHVEAAREATRA